MNVFTTVAPVIFASMLICANNYETGNDNHYGYSDDYEVYKDYLNEYDVQFAAPTISVGKRTSNTDKNCPACNCGMANSWTRIVGGWMTKVHEYPWMAGLTRKGRVFCGGTLITSEYIMTAAHCVVRNAQNTSTAWVTESVKIVLAEHNTAITEETMAEWLSVTKVIVHERFSRTTFDHDIALLKLARKVQFRHGLRTVCLPPKGGSYEGELATVAGWGYTSEGGPSATSLMETNVPILSLNQCRHRGYRPSRITNNMMCAGDYNMMDSCQGDSGGALLVVNDYQQMMAVGIVSWGEGCARPRKPGVYARVDKHIDWILDKTQDACYCH